MKESNKDAHCPHTPAPSPSEPKPITATQATTTATRAATHSEVGAASRPHTHTHPLLGLGVGLGGHCGVVGLCARERHPRHPGLGLQKRFAAAGTLAGTGAIPTAAARRGLRLQSLADLGLGAGWGLALATRTRADLLW